MTPDHGGRRWLAALVLLPYGAFMLFLLLSTSAQLQIWVVATTADLLAPLLPDRIVSGARVEMGLNALMVVPLILLAAMVFPRVRWQDWTAYGFVGSCAAELVQGLALAERSATFVDVVANGLGAFLGAVTAAWLRRRRSSPSSPSDSAWCGTARG